MKTKSSALLGMLGGVALGAVAVHGLHAQAKPQVYYIAEIDVSNPEAYAKEYVPTAQATIRAAGGRFLVSGGKTTPIEGDPPKSRIVVQVWDSVEKIQAWHASADYREARKVGDKYAKFRGFAVEGVPQ